MYTVHAELISFACYYALKVIGHKVETSNPTGFLEKQIREQLISKK
jgi:putative lipoic acid-binding regulatory protein